jgi:hypothetical protein
LSDYALLSASVKEIDKLRADQLSHLANGGAKSFDEYRHVCGVIRGLTHAESIIKDLVQRSEISDD